MQKIMFNSYYGLQQSVLKGTKTMTRRPVGKRMTEWDIEAYLKGHKEVAYNLAQYKIGEIVAVAQPYSQVYTDPFTIDECLANELAPEFLKDEEGWNNKMFVKAAYMPRRIEITDIKIELLQDISDEDCLLEGVDEFYLRRGDGTRKLRFSFNNAFDNFDTPREAFIALIDKVSKKGTWDRNDWQFAYSFKLVK